MEAEFLDFKAYLERVRMKSTDFWQVRLKLGGFREPNVGDSDK